MNLKDLSREELLLLNTDFGEELEKQASAIVDDNFEKVAEMEEVAGNCYEYGEQLAMQKIAEMEEKYKEGKKKKEGEEEEEEEAEEKSEKTASAMGSFILEGFWNTMMEKGAEYYGDEAIYIEELCKETGMDKEAGARLDAAKALLGKGVAKGKELGSKALEHTKNRYKSGWNQAVRAAGKNKAGKYPGKERLKAGLQAAKSYSPELAALTAGTTYAATR